MGSPSPGARWCSASSRSSPRIFPRAARHSSIRWSLCVTTRTRRLTLDPFLAGKERRGGPRSGEVPFAAHVALLQFFLTHRDEIVERIQGALNARRHPIAEPQDGSVLFRHFEDCFFTFSAVTPSHVRLRGQLEDAHWAS